MRKKKHNGLVIALNIVITAIIAVGAALAVVEAGFLPSNLSKKETTEQISCVSGDDDETTQDITESTQDVTGETSSSEPENTTENTTENITEPVTEPQPTEPDEQGGKEILYTTADLNVRTGPGTTYEKVGMLAQGTKVVRTGEANGWSTIEYNGGIKYVSSEFLSKNEPSASETNIAQVQRKVVDPNVGNWNLIIVNAYIEYTKSYKPELKEVCPGMGYDRYLDARAADHYTDMYNAAKKDGIILVPVSGYRSYAVQERNWKERIANEQANGYSYNEAVARASEVILPPGTSEHNLGIAMDICSLNDSFADTKEFAWLCQHAEEYGFILRYKAEWKDKTGIVSEPWHWRYVGVENAKKINASGLCLEEYVEKYGTD